MAEIPGLGIRHSGDRRDHERRDSLRPPADRRRRGRRRRAVRSLLLAVTALATPSHIRTIPLQASVSVTIDNFQAVPAREAYTQRKRVVT